MNHVLDCRYEIVVFIPIISCQVTGSHWLAHPKPQLCDYCEDIIVHIDT